MGSEQSTPRQNPQAQRRPAQNNEYVPQYRYQQPPQQNLQQQRNLNPQKAQQIYRQATNKDQDMKEFTLDVYLNKDSVKTQLTADNKVQISFKIDANCDYFLRVNCCVTEQKNENNVPVMMFTPNKQNYVQELQMRAGLGQVVPFEKVSFDLNYLKGLELFKCHNTYTPIIMSVNYVKNQQPFAFINYGLFTKNSQNEIDGIRITKQIVLINQIPFEIKNIYGLESEKDKVYDGLELAGDKAGEDDSNECLVCLSESKNTIIMPCSHMCVCYDCGKTLQEKRFTCPICRGIINSIVPLKNRK